MAPNASSNLKSESPTPIRCSREMRAVLRIIEADEHLVRAVLPFINVKRESIDWDQIFSN